MLSPDTELELGRSLEAAGRREQAIAAYWRAIELDAAALEPHERLAALYRDLRFSDRAYWYAAKLARLKGLTAPALVALAKANFQLGKLPAALHNYRQALSLSACSPAAHSDYLFALLHDHRQTPLSLRAAHQEWFSRHCLPARARRFSNVPHPHRPLRVGYVSGEFKPTPATYFLLPIVKQHDRFHFEIFCYHLAETSDAVAEEYKKYAAHWRENLHPPGALFNQILSDRIDILVDLSGHFVQHGLSAFQRRAAPVQVAYPNYPATTGCRQIDYFLSDRWTTPGRFEKHYAEKAVYRLPSGCLVYAPQPDSPGLTMLPASRNGHLTFGLFQRPAKFNAQLWDAVSAILLRVPRSRLLIQHADRDLEDPASSSRGLIERALAERGVNPSRIDFIGLRSVREHLEIVSLCDIALDTFPYNGQTTTCACLWMGVPVVTLAGGTHAGRVGCALLNRLELPDWVASSPRQYVQIAVSKAADLSALAGLRAGLRRRMARSSICRPEIVVREIEEAYRNMWQRWCAITCATAPRKWSAG